jgi:hypothetical protein
MASVNRTIVSVSTGPDLINILTQELLYCQRCGDGCEGSFQLTTYDTQTGDEYSLCDVVQAGIPRLRDLLTEDFMARYGSRAGSEGMKRQVEEVLASADPQKTGIYAEAGKAWMNIGDFVFSCADGNLFPMQIPSSILKDGFLKKLNP